MLSTRLALDHVLLGDWDLARIEVKKMHEREAVIAELRSKEIEDAQAKGEENNVTTTYKDLKGYPVELLEETPRSSNCATAIRALSGTMSPDSSTNHWANPAWRRPDTARPLSCGRAYRCSKPGWPISISAARVPRQA